MTAVEWLIEQICSEHTDAWKEEIKQALEMENQQIKNAWNNGVLAKTFEIQFEQYYNETYKSE
jgi:hypothetical protein